MARRAGKSPLKSAKAAIKRTTKKISSRLHHTTQQSAAPAPKPRKRAAPGAARPVRRKADIPVEILDRNYTPKQTSLKASFRTSGADRERDQELAGGFADERWNDEDRFTNKSGDPRIGTHRRRYEPGE